MVIRDIWGNRISSGALGKPSFSLDIYSKEPDRDSRRTLGNRDKQIVYLRDKKKCRCCGKKLDLTEAQIGHNRAWSKGGSTTLSNAVLLCYRCNKLQGTETLAALKNKLGQKDERSGQKKQTKRKPKRRSSNPWGIEPLRIKPIDFRIHL